jgi:esterase/lipase superfamily enzyme
VTRQVSFPRPSRSLTFLWLLGCLLLQACAGEVAEVPKPPGEFFPILRDRIAESKQKEALVFVHGYNVTFEEASRQTAQLAYDLGARGVPILYGWLSQGKLAGYLVDETNVEWTVPHLRDLLAQLAPGLGRRRSIWLLTAWAPGPWSPRSGR